MALVVDRRTEIEVDGAWVDVTSDVRESAPVAIERGAKNESAKPGPSKLSLTLNNRHGKYSPRNPMSPYYGLIGRNTPIRFSVQGPQSYLQLDGTSSSYARTPDTAALDITGDLDLRFEGTLDWRATPIRTLIGKWTSAGNQRSYLLRVAEGLLTLNWSPDGTAQFFAQQALPALPRRAAVRATLDVDNGAGGFTAVFYWADSLDGPWTQIGDPIPSPGVTSIYSGTAPLEIGPPAVTGYTPVAGRVYRAEVRSGIGGTVVASPDLRALAEGTTSWTDSAGRTWTIGAAGVVSDREYRFTGEISAWPVRWDVSGADVWTPIEAAGVTRRLGQGQKALQSTLRRRIPSDPDLIAYWPMEDGESATAAYSPMPGIQHASMPGFDFGANDSLGGSDALPKVTNPSSFRAAVPRSSSQGWQVELVYYLPTMPAVQTEILRIDVASSSAMRAAVVYASTAGVRIEAQDAAGDVIAFFLFSASAAVADFTGKWNRLAVYTATSGGTTYLYVSWRDIAANSRHIARTAFTGTQGAVTAVAGSYGAATVDMVLGHLAVFDIPATGSLVTSPPGSNIFAGADDGFAGQGAMTRIARLATEEADQVLVTTVDGDTTADSEAMGPQRPGTLLALLEEAAATDGGILYETRDALALVYRDRTTLYNQPVALALDYTAPGEVPPPLEPVEDDQLLRNDVTVTRAGGSSGRAILEDGPLSVQPPPHGVGTYDEAVTLSLYDDEQPQPIAEWRMHLGTWDEARYPTVTVWLHAAPHLVDQVLGMDIGDRLQISNPPAWLPPGVIDQHMRGYTERITAVEWSLTMNCSPAGPWTVGVVEDPSLGRADTDGSRLAIAVTETATSWPVTVTDGPVWITTAALPSEFPFDVVAGGEQATVTAIAPAVNVYDTFSRLASSLWGTSNSGHVWTQSGGPASDRAVNGSAATVALSAPTSTWRVQRLGVNLTDCEVIATMSVSQAATGNALSPSILLRWQSDTDFYVVRVYFFNDNLVYLSLYTNDAGTIGGFIPSPYSYIADQQFQVRARIDGQRVRARVWPAGGIEPETWLLDQTVATATNASGDVGMLIYAAGGNTNVNPVVSVHDWVCPQVMTVTRSVNGIVKPHAAGTDLRLAQPTIAAL